MAVIPGPGEKKSLREPFVMSESDMVCGAFALISAGTFTVAIISLLWWLCS